MQCDATMSATVIATATASAYGQGQKQLLQYLIFITLASSDAHGGVTAL
jgi:hypothetical protein